MTHIYVLGSGHCRCSSDHHIRSGARGWLLHTLHGIWAFCDVPEDRETHSEPTLFHGTAFNRDLDVHIVCLPRRLCGVVPCESVEPRWVGDAAHPTEARRWGLDGGRRERNSRAPRPHGECLLDIQQLLVRLIDFRTTGGWHCTEVGNICYSNSKPRILRFLCFGIKWISQLDSL